MDLGEGRWRSWPEGVHATIVNRTPIVIDGELVRDRGFPGKLLVTGVS